LNIRRRRVGLRLRFEYSDGRYGYYVMHSKARFWSFSRVRVIGVRTLRVGKYAIILASAPLKVTVVVHFCHNPTAAVQQFSETGRIYVTHNTKEQKSSFSLSDEFNSSLLPIFPTQSQPSPYSRPAIILPDCTKLRGAG